MRRSSSLESRTLVNTWLLLLHFSPALEVHTQQLRVADSQWLSPTLASVVRLFDAALLV